MMVIQQVQNQDIFINHYKYLIFYFIKLTHDYILASYQKVHLGQGTLSD